MELARQNDQFQKFYPRGGDHGKEGAKYHPLTVT